MMAQIESLESWIALPELDLAVGDVTYDVLKLGCLHASLEDALAAGVANPWVLPESAPQSDVVLLGTITINTEQGPSFMRLPPQLAEWVLDALTASWAAAERGIRLSPRRVQFTVLEDSVFVSYPDDPLLPRAPGVDPLSTNLAESSVEAAQGAPVPRAALTIYVDESGNSGDVAITDNYGGQRVFVLVGVGEDQGSDVIGGHLKHVHVKHGARGKETKKRSITRRPELVGDLVERLAPEHPFFIEVMDKKFYLATLIVMHVLRSEKFDPLTESGIGDEFATLLTDQVDDRVLDAYRAFGRERNSVSFEAFAKIFRSGLLRAEIAMNALQEREVRIFKGISHAFDAAIRERGGNLESFLPAPDLSRRRKSLYMLPHVNAFANLLGRVNAYSEGARDIEIVHDEQLQYDAALLDSLVQVDANGPLLSRRTELVSTSPKIDWDLRGRVKLRFADSEGELGVQAADSLAGFCNKRMLSALAGQTPTEEQERVLNTLMNHASKRRAIGVNIVATWNAAKAFWGGSFPHERANEFESLRQSIR